MFQFISLAPEAAAIICQKENTLNLLPFLLPSAQKSQSITIPIIQPGIKLPPGHPCHTDVIGEKILNPLLPLLSWKCMYSQLNDVFVCMYVHTLPSLSFPISSMHMCAIRCVIVVFKCVHFPASPCVCVCRGYKGFILAPGLPIIYPVPPLPRGCGFMLVAITVVKPAFGGLQCCLPLRAMSWSIVCWLYLGTHLMC